MSEFWLWFWRPIAEVLGVIALLCALVAIVGVVILCGVVWDTIKARWQARTK